MTAGKTQVDVFWKQSAPMESLGFEISHTVSPQSTRVAQDREMGSVNHKRSYDQFCLKI